MESHDGPPAELFIHGQTYFDEEEWNAFEEAAPPETNVVGVRIRQTQGETKLFRDGDYPVLRGTTMILNDRNALLWDDWVRPATRHLYRARNSQSAFHHDPEKQNRRVLASTVS